MDSKLCTMLCSNNERSEINSKLCTEFQPSLLRGLRTPYSVLTSWEEMYRIITQDHWVAEQTQLFRATHDDKYKHSLPAVTTAVQLDGKGKAVENIVGYTGVTHCDFDHVPAERLDSVIEKAKADPHTLLCNVSPSGNGVHIYARYKVAKDLKDYKDCYCTEESFKSLADNYHDAFMTVNCYYADLLGLPFDEQCSNPNKTLSLSHDPEAYYNPSSIPFEVASLRAADIESDTYYPGTACPVNKKGSPCGTVLPSADMLPAMQDHTDKLSTMQEQKDTQPTLHETEECPNGTALVNNPVQAERSAGVDAPTVGSAARRDAHLHTHLHWVKEYTDPIEFAEKYVREKQGITYTEGHRNEYLYNCLNIFNLLGVPRTDAERWTQSLDLPEREKQSILKSAYKRTNDFGKFERPYTWKEEVISETKTKTKTKTKTETGSQARNFRPSHSPSFSHTPAREETDAEAETRENEERQRRSPRMAYHPYTDFPLPKFIQQIVDCGESKAQRDAMRLSAFTVLGAMLGKLLSFSYDKRPWYPSLQVFVIAPPASGKSCVSLVRHLAEPLHDELLAQYDAKKKKYEKDKAAYDIAGKERANMEIPVQPTMKMFLISGNNSSTGILENLADADGNALICESEADTLSAAINSDYGHWDVIVRKAHDHDRLSYNRRTNKEYREIKDPCMGVLICGTPAQVKPLIPSAENGLFSRQIFATLPPINEFLDKFNDNGINLNRTFRDWGRELNLVLSVIRRECSSFVFTLTDSQRQMFLDKFMEIMTKAETTRLDDHMKSSVARMAVNLLRMMSVVAFFRAMENLDFQEICQHPKEVQITRLLLACPGLEPGENVPKENLNDGICPNYTLRITDEDLHGMLDMVEPLYSTASDILTLLPWTEAERIQLTPIEQVLGDLPLRFTRQQALEKAQLVGVNEDQLDGKLRRMRRNGAIRLVESGVYEFVGRRTSRNLSRACVRKTDDGTDGR